MDCPHGSVPYKVKVIPHFDLAADQEINKIFRQYCFVPSYNKNNRFPALLPGNGWITLVE
jgi:hypothetical protein